MRIASEAKRHWCNGQMRAESENVIIHVRLASTYAEGVGEEGRACSDCSGLLPEAMANISGSSRSFSKWLLEP